MAKFVYVLCLSLSLSVCFCLFLSLSPPLSLSPLSLSISHYCSLSVSQSLSLSLCLCRSLSVSVRLCLSLSVAVRLCLSLRSPLKLQGYETPPLQVKFVPSSTTLCIGKGKHPARLWYYHISTRRRHSKVSWHVAARHHGTEKEGKEKRGQHEHVCWEGASSCRAAPRGDAPSYASSQQ